MTIFNDLSHVNAGLDSRRTSQALTNFYQLTKYLRQCTHPDEVLRVLKLELMAEARPSYIARIYGRYRKLLPRRDLELIDQWRALYDSKQEREKD